ncbi:nucleotide-diphospho-sugar transferase [Dactylonectria estremocensis]|uniref:Nucleotide-diphospho-sugar transferase n=1 Tax=Dactylonectria estremocensis TaxID=1079267 RepID=A0A9P9IRP2_9HYPO|nr:nucleotide-diphospho-sugar transferase [Dactylonectria estremocensis]
MKVAPSLPLWAWICVLLHLAGIHGLGLDPSADPPLRAAFVTLAHEPDLPAVLFSMHQLEERFVNRYQYHWIFFSTRELSDGFKCLTSNATSATCIYEVIADEHWGTSDWTGQPSPRPFGADVQFGPEPEFPAVDAQRRYRWNSGLFARERRLKDYDWFWKVEPGSQLTQDLHFDVFRFLRDTGIEYGFHRDAHAETKLRLLSPQVKSFIDKHPDLLHKEANVSWLFDTPNSETGRPGLAGQLDDGHSRIDDENDEGDDMISSLAEAFTSWLSGIYENSLYPTFEIGSLALFRSPNHAAFFDHLDSAGAFYDHSSSEVPLHTLSASMFLPRQSVWNFSKGILRHRAHQADRPSQPKETPERDINVLGSIRPESTGAAGSPDATKEMMARVLAYWEQMARDLERQEAIPGLRSGNTVIDERNFALA